MAIQTYNGTTGSNTSPTSTLTLPGFLFQAGQDVLVAITTTGVSVAHVTDVDGHTYTLMSASGGSGVRVELWQTANVPAASNAAITVDLGASTSLMSVAAESFYNTGHGYSQNTATNSGSGNGVAGERLNIQDNGGYNVAALGFACQSGDAFTGLPNQGVIRQTVPALSSVAVALVWSGGGGPATSAPTEVGIPASRPWAAAGLELRVGALGAGYSYQDYTFNSGRLPVDGTPLVVDEMFFGANWLSKAPWGSLVGKPCSNYLVPIADTAYPDTNWAAFGGGPWSYKCNLYVVTGLQLRIVAVPQFWKSVDGGLTWTNLPLPATALWNLSYRGIYTWNPAYAPNIVTFSLGDGSLIDFDLNTETWGTRYATNMPYPAGVLPFLVRMNDGRIRAFIINSTNESISWASCNANGDGVWDTTGNVLLGPQSPWSAYFYNAVSDPSNVLHILYGYNSASSSTPMGYYAQLSASDVLSSPVSVPAFPTVGSLSASMLAGPDGKLHVGTISQNPSDPTHSNSKLVAVFTGSNFTSPTWTLDHVTSYVYAATASSSYVPSHVQIAFVAGQLTVMWDGQFYVGSAGEDVRWSTLTTGWSPEQVYMQFNVTTPPPPIESDFGNYPWVGNMVGFCADRPSPNGMALAVYVDTQDSSGGSHVPSAFFYLSPCPPTPAGNYLAMGNKLVSTVPRYIV